MDPFDPAINYGPNDAGISAITIILVTFGLVASIWLFGSAYAFITDLLSKDKTSKDQKK